MKRRSQYSSRATLLATCAALSVFTFFVVKNFQMLRGALPPVLENRPPYIVTNNSLDTLHVSSGRTGAILIIGGDRESVRRENGILETLPITVAPTVNGLFLAPSVIGIPFGSSSIPVRVQQLTASGITAIGKRTLDLQVTDGTFTTTGSVSLYVDPWPPIGINIDFNTDYTTMMPWVDLMHLWRGWGRTATPWVTDATIPMTSDGYPLEDAGVFSYFDGYPNGTYRMKWDGEGTVNFQGASIQNIQHGGNTTTADLIFNRSLTNNGVMMRITGINTSNPVRNMRIIMPGYDLNTMQVYQNDFIARLRPFSVLRLMDFLSTNGNPQVTWNDRARSENPIYTSNKGVPYEMAAELGNATNRDIWICIPALASNDFVRNMARVIRDRLNPALNVYIEYSNEVWNGVFPQYQQVVDASQDNPLVLGGDPWTRAGEQTAYKLKIFSDIFREEFGTGAVRVRPVLAGQAANTYFTEKGLELLERNYGPPHNYLYAISSAPYISLEGALDLPNLTMDSLFVALNDYLHENIRPWLASWRSLAQEYGIKHISYEGGQHLVSYNGVNHELKLASQNDPRMGMVINDLIQLWGEYGGDIFTHYSFVGPHSQWGSWGLLEHLSDAGSPRWDALMARLLPAGDATLDGIVTYDDFTILRDHFGATNGWWTQGDFNGDRVMNDADLSLLRLQIQNLTPAQKQEVDAFGS